MAKRFDGLGDLPKGGNGLGPTKKLGDVLGNVMAKYGLPAVTAREELETAWGIAAGAEIAARTSVGAMRRGVLEVLVDDPILLQELEGYRKAELFAALQERLYQSKISGLKFRRK